MDPVPAAKVSFREKMLLEREQAIIRVVNVLLADKGFEAMTVDEVAAAVGIAKASLYKHFPSKEDLAAAAMASLVRRTQDVIASLPQDASPLDNLRAVLRWAMGVKLDGEMPSLPSQNSSLRDTLMAHQGYVDGLVAVTQALGGWITQAQAQGSLSNTLPPLVVLYTVYARACDPVLEFLQMAGEYEREQIIDLVMAACFEGLNARAV